MAPADVAGCGMPANYRQPLAPVHTPSSLGIIIMELE